MPNLNPAPSLPVAKSSGDSLTAAEVNQLSATAAAHAKALGTIDDGDGQTLAEWIATLGASAVAYSGTVVADDVAEALDVLDTTKAALRTVPLITVSSSRTVTATDLGAVLRADGVTITIPADSTEALPVGAQFAVRQNGATGVTISKGSGVTLAGQVNLTGDRQFAVFTKTAGNVWVQDGPDANRVTSTTTTTLTKLTQAEYDALTPDANTLYVIVG